MKKVYIFLAVIIDTILLAVILKSYFSQKKETLPKAESSSNAAVTQITTAGTVQSASRKTQITATETQAVPSQVPSQQTAKTDTLPAVTSGKNNSKKSYSTDDYAQYQDMSGTFLNGSSGFVWQELTDHAEKLTDLSDVLGGWKAYIVSSPDDIEHSVTYLMNIKLSGTEKQVTVTLDWDYFYVNNSGDEGHSSEPDSVYSGPWTDAGTVYAEGAGAVSLYEFDYENGKQYGLGTVFWPDGTYGAIALVRP